MRLCEEEEKTKTKLQGRKLAVCHVAQSRNLEHVHTKHSFPNNSCYARIISSKSEFLEEFEIGIIGVTLGNREFLILTADEISA